MYHQKKYSFQDDQMLMPRRNQWKSSRDLQQFTNTKVGSPQYLGGEKANVIITRTSGCAFLSSCIRQTG